MHDEGRKGMTRRGAAAMLAGAVVAAGASPALAQGGSDAPAPAYLVVGDAAASRLHIYAIPDLRLAASFDTIRLAAHAGTIALADGRVLLFDDLAKQVVVLRLAAGATPVIERRIPAPIPLPTGYAWAAVDPAQSVLALTGLDPDESVKLLTLIDLKTYAARQFRVDTGSPDAEMNLALGASPDPVVLLHLAEKVESYRLSDLMTPEARIGGILDGTIKPAGSLPLGKGGHSNSWSPTANLWAGSTLRGFETANLDRTGALVGHKVVSWEADGRGGGRNARQRLTFDGRHVFGSLNPTVPPAQWADAEVDLHWVDLSAGTARRVPLARGAVGRGGVSGRFAIYASIHPDGDHAHLVDADPASPGFRSVAARIALPKLANGPVAGQPTTGREGRFSAITPDGRLAFVTQGGEGKIHVVDTAAKAIARTIEVPTPLAGGGYVAAFQPGLIPADLSAR